MPRLYISYIVKKQQANALVDILMKLLQLLEKLKKYEYLALGH